MGIPTSLSRSVSDEQGRPRDFEAQRLNALRRYRVFGTSPEESFDRLTRLASDLFGTDVAAVSLVGESRQWPKSCSGLQLGSAERGWSFCHYAIQREALMIVEDARTDPRFAEAPFVTGDPHLRFYAGAPLMSPDGYPLGTFCIMDTEPRSAFGERSQARLADLAAAAVDELELRRRVYDEEHRRQLVEGLVESLPGVFYLFDEKRRLVRWNDRLEEVTGYTPEEIRTRSLPELIAERERAADCVQEGFATGAAVAELHLLSKDGRQTPYYCYLRRLQLDGQTHLVGMGVDVTARKEAQAALRRSEKRHRTLVERASDIMTILGPKGTVRYESPSARQVLGRSRKSLVGKNIFGPEGIHPEDVDQVRRVMSEGFERPEAILTVRYRMQHAKGYWIPLESTVRNLLDDEAVGGFVANTRDVTDSLRYEAEHEARERAEELLETKTALLDNVSHEMRTPLAAIIGFAEVLEEEAVEDTQAEFAGRIRDSGKRLQQTLDSVLQLTRLESKRAKFERQPVDLAAAVREAAEEVRPEAEEKGLALRVEAPDEMQALLSKTALHRVLGHLLSNAVKFTEEGAVTVRVEAKPSGAARLDVEDTGIGMSEEFQESGLFESFRQESSGLSRSHAGNGLGLAITARLVDRMGGTIDVTSQKGKGTRFTVTFQAKTLSE